MKLRRFKTRTFDRDRWEANPIAILRDYTIGETVHELREKMNE